MQNDSSAELFSELELPNGAIIPNRLCKAAMEENLADWGQVPGQRLNNLYQHWADGGVGLILTGNVMVAPDALTGPGGVVLQDNSSLEKFKTWAGVGRSGGAQFWMQINHPGRQVYSAMGEQAYSPSDIALDMGSFSKMFAKPRGLSNVEIESLIARFATTAELAEQAGFSGVQIHAAHGYLISQFLSPLVNQRDDQWGGCLSNRARILLETVKKVRAVVSPGFCVSVKLNSADFQTGGFAQQDAKWVVQQLNQMRVDLVELSGGSYERPAMQGGAESKQVNSSTLRREAFFVDFARDIASIAQMPIMVTGGILKRSVAIDALQKDSAGFAVEMLGIARGLAFDPNLVNHWKQNEFSVNLPVISWKNRVLAALAVMSVTKTQLNRMAVGKTPKYTSSPAFALLADQLKSRLRTIRYKRWRTQTK